MPLKPIIGIETYVYTQENENKECEALKLVLLAKDKTGYKNLIKIASIGKGGGNNYKSTVTKDDLLKYHDGIIAFSGGYDSVINYHLLNDNFSQAGEEARYYKLLFGEDFYLSIQDHKLSYDKQLKESIIKLAGDFDISLVAANESFYINKEDAIAHNVMMLARQNRKSKSNSIDITDLKLGSPEFYFKSQEEMRDLFKVYPEALKNME